MDSFGDIVRNFLADRRMSGSDLARLMGLSRQAIATMLSDRNAPTLTRIQQVATALNVSVPYLLMSEEERKRWDTLEPSTDLIVRVSAIEAKLSQQASNPSDELSRLVAQLTPEQAKSLVTLAESYIAHQPPQSSRKKSTGST